MEKRKILVLATAGAALFLFLGGAIFHLLKMPDKIHLNTKGYPTLGKADAKIEMVLFEDLKCPHCCAFSTQVFPLIQEHYINSGLVRYVIVPLAFLEGSKPVANAAIAVYRQNPNRFFDYTKVLAFLCLKNQYPTEDELLKIAKNIGGINLVQLQECIDTHCYYEELDRNLAWAKKLMGKNFGTPSLYIDGISTSTLSFRTIQTRMDKILLSMKETP